MTAAGPSRPSQGQGRLSAPRVSSQPPCRGRCLLMTWQDALTALRQPQGIKVGSFVTFQDASKMYLPVFLLFVLTSDLSFAL